MARQQGTICSGPCACHWDVLPLGEHCLGPLMHAPVAQPQVLLHRLNGWLTIFFWNLLRIFGKTARCLQSLVLSGSLSLLACRVLLAPSVPLAKMVLTESLAPLDLLGPVDVPARLALL